MLATLRDRSTLGAIAGITAILVRDAYSLLAKLIGFATFHIWNIAGDFFLQGKQVYTALGNILGVLADLCMGALLGVFFVHFLRWTGGKNPVLKGLGIGLGAWLLLFGIVFHSLPLTQSTAPKEALSNMSAFVGHAIFGLTLGFAGSKLLALLRTD